MKQCNVKMKNSWYYQKVQHNITEEEKNTHTQKSNMIDKNKG